MNRLQKHLQLFLFLFFTASTIVSAQSSHPKPKVTSMETSIDQIFTDFDDIKKPGAAIAVVQNGEIVFKKGYGSANMEYDIPVTSTTVFHVASVSKQFTVFSLLLLADEGKLSLDDDIRTYIPEVPDFGERITLRHLATHTSGMRDQWDLLAMAGWRFDDVITKEHILKLVSKQKELNFKPGEEYLYCNTGFTLLAEVVARVSGKSFADFTQQEIFQPLKMEHSLFYDDHERIVKNRAYSYSANADEFQKSVLSFANVGATSLFTTVIDLSKWAMNFQDIKVGSKAIIDQMNTLAVLNSGETFGGAYGQFVGSYKGLQQIQHSGADAGYRSYLTRFPEQDFAVSVFSNRGSSNPVSLAHQVADLYLASDFKEERTQEERKPETFINLATEQLKQFENDYWWEEQRIPRKIVLKNDTLRYVRGAGNESPLAPISNTKFRMLQVPVNVYVEFLNDENEQRMRVYQENSPTITLSPYEAVDPEKVDLTTYTGTFYSPELDTAYHYKVIEGKLTATHRRNSDLSMEIIKQDLFRHGNIATEFIRDATNTIIGIKVSTGRVRNLRFEKKGS